MLVVFRHQLPLTSKHEHRQQEEINTLEHQGVLLDELLEVVSEGRRQLRPVQRGIDMVNHMVTIIERTLIVRVVNASVGEAIVAFVTFCVDEDVLGPISEHEKETSAEIWQGERPPCKHGIVAMRNIGSTKEESGIEQTCQRQLDMMLLQRDIWQLYMNRQIESSPITEELYERITLILHRGTQIPGEQVVLVVVHDDMVHVIHSRRDTTDRSIEMSDHHIQEFAQRCRLKHR